VVSESVGQWWIESKFLLGRQYVIELPAHSLPRKSDGAEAGGNASAEQPVDYVCVQHILKTGQP
jgi:hypothetical protein